VTTRARGTERHRHRRDTVCVCVWGGGLYFTSVDADIRVLHLIAGADGSINRTSVCVCVCVCHYRLSWAGFSRDLYILFSPFILSIGPPPFPATSDCLDINYIVISKSLRQRGHAEQAAMTASYTTWHRFKHRLLKYPNALHFFY